MRATSRCFVPSKLGRYTRIAVGRQRKRAPIPIEPQWVTNCLDRSLLDLLECVYFARRIKQEETTRLEAMLRYRVPSIVARRCQEKRLAQAAHRFAPCSNASGMVCMVCHQPAPDMCDCTPTRIRRYADLSFMLGEDPNRESIEFLQFEIRSHHRTTYRCSGETIGATDGANGRSMAKQVARLAHRFLEAFLQRQWTIECFLSDSSSSSSSSQRNTCPLCGGLTAIPMNPLDGGSLGERCCCDEEDFEMAVDGWIRESEYAAGLRSLEGYIATATTTTKSSPINSVL